MSKIRVAESMVIDAKPEEIYALLADYHKGHPRVLPKKYFKSLEIESGGQGAGTVFRTRIRAGGAERSYHMRVTEPAPGVLMETDIPTDLFTTFTVTPVQGGQQASLEIATEWTSPGIKGFFERLFSPSIMQRMYREELQQLVEVVRDKHAAASSAQQ
jgi:hypothetical protein